MWALAALLFYSYCVSGPCQSFSTCLLVLCWFSFSSSIMLSSALVCGKTLCVCLLFNLLCDWLVSFLPWAFHFPLPPPPICVVVLFCYWSNHPCCSCSFLSFIFLSNRSRQMFAHINPGFVGFFLVRGSFPSTVAVKCGICWDQWCQVLNLENSTKYLDDSSNASYG